MASEYEQAAIKALLNRLGGNQMAQDMTELVLDELHPDVDPADMSSPSAIVANAKASASAEEAVDKILSRVRGMLTAHTSKTNATAKEEPVYGSDNKRIIQLETASLIWRVVDHVTLRVGRSGHRRFNEISTKTGRTVAFVEDCSDKPEHWNVGRVRAVMEVVEDGFKYRELMK